MKTYGLFSEWKQDKTPANQKLIAALQRLISTVDPDLTMGVKWGQGCWMREDQHLLYVHCEPDHVQLGFYNGTSLRDPSELLSGNGKFVRFVKISSPDDIKPRELTALIKQAVGV